MNRRKWWRRWYIKRRLGRYDIGIDYDITYWGLGFQLSLSRYWHSLMIQVLPIMLYVERY